MQAVGVDTKAFYQGKPVDLPLLASAAPSGQMAMLYGICESSSLERHRAGISQVPSSLTPLTGGVAQGPAISAGGALGTGMVTDQPTPPRDENHGPFMMGSFNTLVFPPLRGRSPSLTGAPGSDPGRGQSGSGRQPRFFLGGLSCRGVEIRCD